MRTNISFYIPIREKYLFHAPFHRLTALVNAAALEVLQTGSPTDGSLKTLLEYLEKPLIPSPTPRTGSLSNPLFLGIIPTRGCNMACPYCDFATHKAPTPAMSLETARQAVDAYFDLLQTAARTHAEVHFFGGEPFFAEKVIHFIVAYARQRAWEQGYTIRFEVTSNGLYNTQRCHWIAENFDTVVLSLDGLPEMQNQQRPAQHGLPTAEIVIRNAKILSEGTVELILRTCVSDATVSRLPEIAAWMAQEFHPSTVCFETLSLAHNAQVINFTPPDPWEFARAFDQATQILATYGIETVISTADLRAPRLTFCPVGKDALIVSPDGAVDACYLLEKDWQQSGLDMRLGWLAETGFALDPLAIERTRALHVDNRSLCANCLCRYYCAGGCHVNHKTTAAPGEYDQHCIAARAITITRLLRQIGQAELAEQWLYDQTLLEQSVWHPNDRLEVVG